jgi:hypothetical protein
LLGPAITWLKALKRMFVAAVISFKIKMLELLARLFTKNRKLMISDYTEE